MRAKILFLTENSINKQDIRLAQQALSELALAFSHSFVMREMEFSAESTAAELLQKTAEQDAVILAGKEATLEETLIKLGVYAVSMKTDPLALPELSRLKSGAIPSALLIYPLGGGVNTLNKASVIACAQAGKRKADLFYTPGQPKDAWLNELNKAAMYAALPQPVPDTADGLVSRLLYAGRRNLAVFAPQADILFLSRLLVYLSGTERLAHREAFSDNMIYHAVSPLSHELRLPLFSLLFATAAAVRDSLKLEREADCLETVIANVLSSGWRTPEFGIVGEQVISEEDALDLITQQVQLAGELYERMSTP